MMMHRPRTLNQPVFRHDPDHKVEHTPTSESTFSRSWPEGETARNTKGRLPPQSRDFVGPWGSSRLAARGHGSTGMSTPAKRRAAAPLSPSRGRSQRARPGRKSGAFENTRVWDHSRPAYAPKPTLPFCPSIRCLPSLRPVFKRQVARKVEARRGSPRYHDTLVPNPRAPRPFRATNGT